MASIVRSSKSPHSFWTRSTIYNRNERRRAKTLANANDTRPPAMRVLAQFTGGATSVASGATVTTQHSQEASTLSFPFTHSDDDTTVFTTSPPLESLQKEMQQRGNQHHPSIFTAAVEAGISAALGARLAESVTHNLSLLSAETSASLPQTAQNPHHHHHHHVVMNGSSSSSSLALSLPQQQSSSTTSTHHHNTVPLRGRASAWKPPLYFYASSPSSSTIAAQQQAFLSWNNNNSNNNHATATNPTSPRYYTSSMVPLAVLFGTKYFVQHTLERTWGEDVHQPISLAALTASVAAGTAMGVVQMNAFTHHPWSFHLATEAAAAVLYFEAYALLKAAFLGKQSASSQQELSNSHHNNNTNHRSLRAMAAIPLAGAVAGSLYETLRVLGTSERLTLANLARQNNPFVARPLYRTMGPIVARAAPAHACLWLAYETVQSGVFGNDG